LRAARRRRVVINLGPDGLSERCEVVDGKQRITACLMWERGEIPGVLGDSREIWRGDLDGPASSRPRRSSACGTAAST